MFSCFIYDGTTCRKIICEDLSFGLYLHLNREWIKNYSEN